MILHRPRASGGLGLYSVKYKSMAELIRSFLETSINPNFRTNQYHNALFQYHVENSRNIPSPPICPYLPEEIFENIKIVKNEGLLKISTLSSGSWYKVLVENNLTMVSDELGRRSLKPCRAEINHPEVDWEATWRRSAMKGLSSDDHSFLWKLLHNLLPTQERLHRMGFQNTITPNCVQCDQAVPDQLSHALLTCPQNTEVTNWLFECLRPFTPSLTPQQLVLLSLGELEEDQELPIVWIIAKTLCNIWLTRIQKKKPSLFQTRAHLEAGISIMRKTRYKETCALLDNIISR